MPSANKDLERHNLVKEISKALCLWPERDRQIFSQAHYHGQSVETISRSARMTVKEVNHILAHCDQRLHESLKAFRKSVCDQPFSVTGAISRPAA